MELRQWGILLVILGTVLLAFSVGLKPTFSIKLGPREKIHSDDSDDMELLLPKREGVNISTTKAYIVKPLFWGGLFCIAAGSAMQW